MKPRGTQKENKTKSKPKVTAALWLRDPVVVFGLDTLRVVATSSLIDTCVNYTQGQTDHKKNRQLRGNTTCIGTKSAKCHIDETRQKQRRRSGNLLSQCLNDSHCLKQLVPVLLQTAGQQTFLVEAEGECAPCGGCFTRLNRTQVQIF